MIQNDIVGVSCYHSFTPSQQLNQFGQVQKEQQANDKNGSSSLLPPSFVAAVEGLNVAVKGGQLGTFEQNVSNFPAIRKKGYAHICQAAFDGCRQGNTLVHVKFSIQKVAMEGDGLHAKTMRL